ncbi:MAG TPA: iron ABC transporter permease [Candidatus Aminicenantes bacterium]|nr:iron ABC transporter permease [Candidatus Aminicenantes bacterium]
MDDAGEKEKRAGRRLWTIAAVVFSLLALSIFIGRYPRPFLTPLSALIDNELARSLVFHLRLPRILMAFLLGTVLSASGAVFQMIFRNPLVDSGFLGVSQGAAFGASLGIIYLGGTALGVQATAAAFAFLGLAASYFIARRIRWGDWVFRLVLAGISVAALFSAGTGILKYLADPLKHLPDITFWLLGGLWAVTWPDFWQVLPVAGAGLAVMFLMRWRLNLLSMRDETAFSLGLAPGRERIVLLSAAVAATAVLVSKAGQVTWVGLIIPHIARRVVGADAQQMVPASIFIGGIFVLFCDDLARAVLSGEIPLGILTSLFGTVIFIVLLSTRRLRLKA